MTNPTTRDVEPDTAKNQLIELLRAAHDRGERPTVQRSADLSHAGLRGMDLHGADLFGAYLSNADLSGANLSGADLRYANLQNANLQNANLRGASLRHADLRGADLFGADLFGATLWGADLRNADLWEANLQGADLRHADLRETNLRSTNLWGAHLRHANLLGAILRETNLLGAYGGIFQVSGLHPYQATMVPTVEGWRLRIGCWQGTTQELRDLIAKDDGWPEARGHQITARRPLLAALADMCDLHAANHKNDLIAVMERWGTEDQEVTQRATDE